MPTTLPRIPAHGADIPVIGLGTWELTGDTCSRAVEAALGFGYRHIDTAAMYRNEAEVGAGLAASGVARDSIFLTTKVWRDNIGSGALQRSAEESLKKLGVAHVDLLLIHWPNDTIALSESIAALVDAQKRGLTRHIGVSNFPTGMLDEAVALAAGLGAKLAANQCEMHPRLDQTKLLAACARHGIAFTSYCPLGRGDLVSDLTVGEMADRLGCSPSQVLLRWHFQKGAVSIPRSRTPAHIRENIDIMGFELQASDMAALDGLARSDGRVVRPATEPKWDS